MAVWRVSSGGLAVSPPARGGPAEVCARDETSGERSVALQRRFKPRTRTLRRSLDQAAPDAKIAGWVPGNVPPNAEARGAGS